MSWHIKIDGIEADSDDFTISQLGEIERTSHESWALANPYRSVPVAKAFLAVALLRSGMDKEAVADRLEQITLKQLKSAFTYVADDDEAEEDSDQSVPLEQSESQPSPSSSHGEPDTAGPPTSRESSVSVTAY